MPFIGTTPTQGFVSSFPKQSFTPNGSTTVFTLTNPVATANDLEVFVGNVRQEPTAAYSAAGTTLTMTEAPATGLNFYVINKSFAQVTTSIGANSVSTDKIIASAVTDAKLASTLDLSGKTVTYGLAGADMPSGSVLQVVMGTTATAASNGGSTYADTGLSASITPSATSSKVLAMVNQPLSVSSSTTAARDIGFRLVRGSTDLIQGMAEIDTDNTNLLKVPGYNAQLFLDSPNTTSATTYKTTFRVNAGTSDVYAQQHGATSSIILMEIKG